MKKFEIKITGSGTQEEIVEALRNVANNILSEGAGNPEGLNDELDDTEWEDSTLVTKIGVEEKETYRLVDTDEIDIDSGLVILDGKIRDEELHEFYIVDREELIEDLMRWISEGSKDKELMKQDLEMLMRLDDEYIFSSNSTNDYIDKKDSRFDETCKELIELNETS